MQSIKLILKSLLIILTIYICIVWIVSIPFNSFKELATFTYVSMSLSYITYTIVTYKDIVTIKNYIDKLANKIIKL